MIETIGSFLHEAPVLCLLLSILLGTVIGRVHVKGVGLGAVVGTLLAGLLIGIVATFVAALPRLGWSISEVGMIGDAQVCAGSETPRWGRLQQRGASARLSGSGTIQSRAG